MRCFVIQVHLLFTSLNARWDFCSLHLQIMLILPDTLSHTALLFNVPFGWNPLSLFPVPFRETPSYTNRRRVTGGETLTSSRLLPRSASDNNLNNVADVGTAHSPVPSLRSLPPLAHPGIEAAADGSLHSTASSLSSHSRSPSLGRVGEESGTHGVRRHAPLTHSHSRGRLRWASRISGFPRWIIQIPLPIINNNGTLESHPHEVTLKQGLLLWNHNIQMFHIYSDEKLSSAFTEPRLQESPGSQAGLIEFHLNIALNLILCVCGEERLTGFKR